MKKILRIGGYARVSHEEQKKYGFSIEAQIEKIEKWCKEEEHQLVNIYIDEGFTATNMKRPQLLNLLDNLKNLDAIVFTRLDRFSRNVLEANKMLELLQKHNVALISIEEDDIDTSTADGLFMFNLKVNLAEREAKKGSERIKDVFDYKIKVGQPVSGSLPLGYKIETIEGNKRVVKDEQYIELVNDLFWYFGKYHSVRKTMEYINNNYDISRGYLAYNRILKNPLYTGCFHGNNNYTEPYISIEQFERNQVLIAKNIRERKSRYVHLFVGLIRCPFCGGSLMGLGKHCKRYNRKYYYYRCARKYVHKKCEIKNMLPEKHIETFLLENVEELVKQHIVKVTQVKVIKEDDPKKKIKEIKDEMETLNYMFMKKRIDIKKYDEHYEKLEKELKKLEINAPKEDDIKLLQNFLNSGWRNIYDDMSRENKRALWSNLIKEIKLDKDFNISIDFL